MPSLYALLVAIDNYPADIPTLGGCVNDADAMEAVLQKRFGGDGLHLLRLSNEQATRERIIQSFRQHLSQGEKGDAALFFFAGHGSQVPTGGLFKEIEPDGLNESIVCYDSRVLGAFDLVDKDIATLIREVTKKGIHLTMVMDSCHSGSVTRGIDAAHEGTGAPEDTRIVMERRLPPRLDAQPVGAYLSDPEQMQAAIRSIPEPPPGAGSLTLATAFGFIPDETGTHVLLAACEDNQSAKEYLGQRKRHGAFSYFLTQTLLTAVEPLGYRALMQLVRERMRDCVADQTPKLESSGGTKMLDNPFLGLKPAPLADYFLATRRITGIWTLDAGSLLGVAEGDQFALYPYQAQGAALMDPSKPVATAEAIGVRPSETVIEIAHGTELITGLMYKAMPTKRSSAIAVGFEGEENGLGLLRAALKSASYIQEGADPRLLAHAKDGKFTVTNGGRDRVLYGPIAYGPVADGSLADVQGDQGQQGADRVISALEHIAKWKIHLALTNPSPKIPADTVQFVITANEAQQSCPPLTHVELAYVRDKFGQTKPFYKAWISSSFNQDLYCALLVFSNDFSITAGLLEAGTQRLATPFGCAPDKLPLPVQAASGREIHCSIEGAATETTDELMLIVSTDWFDAHRYEQPGLYDPQVTTRRMDAGPPTPLHDFFTRRVTFHTTRWS